MSDQRKVAVTEGLLIELIKRSAYQKVIQLIDGVPQQERFSKEYLLNIYGVAQRAIGNAGLAIDYYKCALRLNPENVGAWSNLGNAFKDVNLLQSALMAHERALRLSLRPDAMLLHNYGIALAGAGEHARAEAAFLEALAFDDGAEAIRWDLARAQLAQKKYVEGFANYQFRWASKDAPPRRVTGCEWDGSVTEKPLYIYVEQGFGDYLQCIRFVPLVRERAPSLTVEVKPELKALMSNSYPDITFVDYDPTPRRFDKGYVVSIADLPGFFVEKSVPYSEGYLSPLPAHSDWESRVTQILGKKRGLNIGIVWSGSVTFKRNGFRSADVAYFNRLAAPLINLYSLQLGPRKADVEKLPIGFISEELSGEIQTFNDTANLAKKLDLVVMTCSSTAHLCGALGVPCWVLLDSSPHWLWGESQLASDWYKSLRLFRQSNPGGWSKVFDDVAAELFDMAAHL